jgi:hypothetical protein
VTFTVREFLDAGLATDRMEHLKELCKRFTGEPLDATVADLREVLGGPISMEDFRRLHILISHLYHACGAPIPLMNQLRTEANASLARHREPTAPAPVSTPGRR